VRHLEIVLAALKQGDNYLLQRRGDIPVIGGAGLLGFFGGKIEDEAPAVAICRELAEETTYKPKPDQAKFLGEVNVKSDHKLEEVSVRAQVFGFEVSEDKKVFAKEGELVAMTYEEAMANLDKMTTGTRAYFEELIGKD
jgi:8-oxo-dGTP pyrophosphatase MutT (NUDIX family)